MLSKALRAAFIGITILALVVSCAGSVFLNEVRRPASPAPRDAEFVVEDGDSTSQIATRLADAGLVRQPLLFSLLVRRQGLDDRLQAGRYMLNEAMTMSEIIVALQSSRVEEVQITIIEGLRLEEIAEVFGSAGLTNVSAPGFLAAARDADAFREGHFLLSSLPQGASLEGYLFPDTYRFVVTVSVEEVIETMLTRFDEQYLSFETEIQVPDATVHEIVTMASIVQREAARTDEMARIAAVFWNRLKPEHAAETGGLLGADPTVQYVIGAQGDWWPQLNQMTLAEIIAVPGPYNTRVSPGLPPGPISTPGLAALRAAARPDATAEYLYFVVACDGDGQHLFARTYAEFQQYEQEFLACSTR